MVKWNEGRLCSLLLIRMHVILCFDSNFWKWLGDGLHHLTEFHHLSLCKRLMVNQTYCKLPPHDPAVVSAQFWSHGLSVGSSPTCVKSFHISISFHFASISIKYLFSNWRRRQDTLSEQQWDHILRRIHPREDRLWQCTIKRNRLSVSTF